MGVGDTRLKPDKLVKPFNSGVTSYLTLSTCHLLPFLLVKVSEHYQTAVSYVVLLFDKSVKINTFQSFIQSSA